MVAVRIISYFCKGIGWIHPVEFGGVGLFVFEEVYPEAEAKFCDDVMLSW